MATIVSQLESALAGGQPTFVNASAGGDQVLNPIGNVALWFLNESTSAITITIAAARSCNFGFPHAATVVIQPGTGQKLETYDPRRWTNDAGYLVWTYSSATSLRVAAVTQTKKLKG